LRVSYRYDRGNGDNVVDLGLFEPGSLDLGTRAFRGYSGGSKDAIVISPRETTPGYRPGPVPAGQWHVLLGLYKVAEAGVEVTISVDTEKGDAPSALPVADRSVARPARPAQSASPSRWYVGALHTHTLHSDGTVSPVALMQRFRDARFDFVAVTDHNNTTHQYDLAPHHPAGTSPLWIIGEEVTTPGGHASVWGLGPHEWVDFRVSPQQQQIGTLVATARRFGAIFSVNHPASQCVACGWTHEFVDGIEAIEISNGRHGEVASALAIWDRLLNEGRRVTGVGSSDWHTAPNAIDDAHVRVQAAALTEDAILGSIRAGRVIVMRSVRDVTPDVVVESGGAAAGVGESLVVTVGDPLQIRIRAPGLAGAELVVIENGSRALRTKLDPQGNAHVDRRASLGFVRFELYSSDGLPVAITNPVYLVSR